ncbi:MAG TPA: serine hydrolase [Actinospica sp.]|nr:serine hydrolase [Actinospica sp.]
MSGSTRLGRQMTAVGIAVSLAGAAFAVGEPAQAVAAPTSAQALRVAHAPARAAAVGEVGATSVTGATSASSAAGITSSVTGPTGISAAYAEIEETATGSEIWGRSEGTEVPMGSITKVMTAIVVLESAGLNLNQLNTVPDGITAYDNEYGASTAGLVPGQQLTTLDLLYALLVPSGCDAAYTLAQAYGPGLAGFIAKMNTTAAALGLKNTHFSDFSGLPDPTEYSTYSTPSDLINLGRIAMQIPLFAQIVKTSQYHLDAVTGEHPAFTWNTTNPILGVYAGTEGIKTGSTNAAGDCLLFEAVKGHENVIGIVLDDPSWNVVAADSETLLNYGFANYPGGALARPITRPLPVYHL